MWNVLSRCTISFADMAFGKSVVLHFPQEIQKNLGISEAAPQLLRALDADMIDAVQFLKSSRVRVTCKTDDLLEGSTFLFGDVPIPVTAADHNIRFVFVRDLPFEVPDDGVKSVFERFGVVHSMSPCFFRDFLSVSNGTHRLVMSFREAIPWSVSVADFPVCVFHAGQPVICSVCHESGHLPQACPFSGLCLRCKQPGQVARNCTLAWGSSSSNAPVPASSSSTPVSMSVDPSVSSTASTSSTAPVLSVPSVTAPASVSAVTAVSTPIPSVLPVSTSPVPVSSAFPPQCHPLLLKMEKSPKGRAAPLHLLCPVLLLSSLLLFLYRLAVLPLPGMRMSPCLRLVHPLPGQPSLLVPHVPHPLITRDLSVWLCL